LGASTATFSGAISSVSPTFTGTPTAPTASAGTNTTQIATTAFVLANGVPTGGLIMWSTASAPNGFLLCDGSAVSRTTYAALFAIVSTTFGVGDGSTTFNVPNYTNRMPYGTTVGATGGSANATLVEHTHTFTGTALGNHNHSTTFNQTSKSNNATPYMLSNPFIGENLNGSVALDTTSASAGTPAGTNSTVGSSATNANLPPYLGINFIIKT
jgi:microcystin-dependent protein